MTGHQSAELHFEQLVRILLRQWRFILTVAILGSAIVSVAAIALPTQYTAKAQLIIEAARAGSAADSFHVDEGVVGTHVTMLMSRGFLQSVTKNLLEEGELVSETGQLGSTLSGWLDELWTRVSDPVAVALASSEHLPDTKSSDTTSADSDQAASSDSDQATSVDPDQVSAADIDEVSAAEIDAFEEHLSVYQERRSAVIRVSFTSTTASDAAAIANRVVELYVESQAARKKEQVSTALASLDSKIPELRAAVARADAAVQSYRAEHGFIGGTRADMLNQQITDLDRQLTTANSDLSGLRVRLSALRKITLGTPEMAELIKIIDVPALADFFREHPEFLEPEAEFDPGSHEDSLRTQLNSSGMPEIRKKFGQEVSRATNLLEKEALSTEERARSIQERLVAVQKASREMAEAAVRMRELEREAAAVQQVFDGALRRREELGIQDEAPPDVRVLSRAWPPDEPSSPHPLKFIAPAFVLFFVGAGLLAVARDRLDRGLRSEDDIARTLGIPCIGIVPRLDLEIGSLRHEYLLSHPTAPYSEAIRSLVASLLQLANPKASPKLILVSSSLPEEGKTTLAVSIATYAAVLGRRVLLVDLDLRRPRVLNELNIEAQKGVSDVLLGNCSLAEAICRAPVPGIECLPAPRAQSDPLPLFANGRVSWLLNQIREDYDCVVIDSPALQLVTEARLLASMVDRVILVTKWGSTRPEVAQNALSLLREVGISDTDDTGRIGAVIAQADLKEHAYYGYGDAGESLERHRRYFSQSR
ncbi:GumC family protein [Microvirga massiliensis]|uniref:GumC family protein n=1 Tax=Microvirga massiliensis TaxID=1033741 RepID=UPI00065FE77F|nr:AAA family ATPase [Microvirga massiliensis]